MMLDWLGERYSHQNCIKAAAAIEAAVIKTLASGIVVPDLGGKATTMQMAEAIATNLSP